VGEKQVRKASPPSVGEAAEQGMAPEKYLGGAVQRYQEQWRGCLFLCFFPNFQNQEFNYDHLACFLLPQTLH